MGDLTPGQRLIMAYEANEIGHISELAKAIDAAIAGEREACAALCDWSAQVQGTRAAAEGNDYASERAVEASKIAAAIRARGEAGDG